MYIQPGAWCFPVSHYWSFLYSILSLCSRIAIGVPDKKNIFFYQIVAFLWILLLEVHSCQWWSMMMKVSSTFFIHVHYIHRKYILMWFFATMVQGNPFPTRQTIRHFADTIKWQHPLSTVVATTILRLLVFISIECG